jgi:thiamine pyrophosphokinase
MLVLLLLPVLLALIKPENRNKRRLQHLTVCWLLPATSMNHIQLPRFDSTVLSSLGEGPTCGLMPVGGAVDSVTTTKFKWDLHQDAAAFGGLVSTSNRVMMAETVTVTSSHPLLVFTAEVFSGIPEQEE